jgi:two-component sensor histidine kinase
MNSLFHKFFITISFCLLLTLNSFAVDSTRNIISYQHIDIEQGLAGRQANCGLQDSRGFVWIGTTHGLQRYDGKNFKTFTKEKDGLQDNIVSRILEDDQQQLWIMYGLFAGLAYPIPGKVDILDLKTNKIQTLAEKFGNKLPFSVADAGVIYGNEKHELFLINTEKDKTTKPDTYGNTFYYSSKTGFQKRTELVFYPILYKDDYIITWLKGRTILYKVSDDKQFPIKLNTGENFQFPYTINKENKFIYNQTDVLKDEGYKSIPINAIERLQTIPLVKSNTPNKSYIIGGFYDVHSATDILYLYQKEIYLLEDGKIIKLLNASAWEKEFKLNILSHFTTSDKQHWICTSNGIYVVKIIENKFEHLISSDKHFFNNTIQYQARNIMVDGMGGYFFNNWGGIYQVKKQPNNNWKITNLFIDRNAPYNSEGAFFDGSTLFGYRSQYNTASKKADFSFPFNENIWTGIKSKNGQNIVSTNIHVCLQNGLSLTPITFGNGSNAPNNWVQQFYYTKDGTLWAAGNNGIFIINEKNCVSVHYSSIATNPAYKIPTNEINSLLEDKNGIIWLATADAGLIKWDRQKNSFEKITTENGLSSNTLYGILEDEKRNLWISSDYGLMRYNPTTKQINIFTTADGITNNEFNRCSFLKGVGGEMLFGGLDGVNIFHPKDFGGDSVSFTTALKIVSYNQFDNSTNKLEDKTNELLLSNKIVVKPGNNFFTLEFQLQDYNAGEKKYAYMIDGIDKDWNYIKENSIRISGLPYGEYILKVKGQNSEGSWSNKEISISLTIITPLIKKWWFITLLVLTGLALLYFYLRYRTFKLANEKKVLEQTVDIRTKELNKSLQQKEVLLKEIHHRVKNNLSIISGLLDLQSSSTENEQAKLAMQESQNRISAIALIHQRLYQNENMGAIEIKGFVEDMYGQIATVFSSIDVKIKTTFIIPDVFLDIDTAVPLGLIINELITNSFKYAFNKANEGSIKINFEENQTGHYTLTYNDNGPGLPASLDFAKGKTLGIRLIKLLSQQLSGKAVYENEDGSPTFIITLKDSNTRNLE